MIGAEMKRATSELAVLHAERAKLFKPELIEGPTGDTRVLKGIIPGFGGTGTAGAQSSGSVYDATDSRRIRQRYQDAFQRRKSGAEGASGETSGKSGEDPQMKEQNDLLKELRNVMNDLNQQWKELKRS
jgi:hypothetical protein